MSVKPSDEPASEGGWCGEYGAVENMELLGKDRSSARFQDSKREGEQKAHSHHPPHPVTMETASTGKDNSARACTFT